MDYTYNTSTNFGNSQATQTQQSQQTATAPNNDNAKKIQEEISKYYQELGQYSAPSMQNICDIFNSGFKTEGNQFYTEHMGFCDIYGVAASNLGQAEQSKNSDEISSALANVKKATEQAVGGLKGLIVEETSFKDKNNIATSTPNKDSSETDNNKETSQTENPQDKTSTEKEEPGFFEKAWNWVKSIFS